MPRSPRKNASKKERGTAPAARRRASPWSRTDPLFSDRKPLNPTCLHKLAIVLFALCARGRGKDLISIQNIMDEMDEHPGFNDPHSSCPQDRKRQLRNIRDALSSFEAKDFIEWHGLQDDNELDVKVEMSLALRTIFDELLVKVQAEMDGVDLNSLTRVQHRAICMWFRGLAKELDIRNLTKHDMRIAKDELKKVVLGARPVPPDQPQASQVEDADVDGDYDMDWSSDNDAPANQNAVAGPSQLPQTPGCSRMLKGSGAYPTPDSPPRGNWSDIYNVAQTGPRIPALGLSTPADTDSDVEDFQGANEEIATDEVPLTSRERQFQQQISELSNTIEHLERKNESLEKELTVLNNDVKLLNTQLNKERIYLRKQHQERKLLQAVEDAKWKFMSFWRQGRTARLEQLDNEIEAARVNIAHYESELHNLRDSLRQKDVEMEALRRTVAEQAEQLRVKEEQLQETESFYTMFMAKRRQTI
ncbi:hypothetical protein D9619_006446 [Psilocybe cf. subviscida]|uniref:Uncharacterized protein n=1 Tax=Psilocybe cf. subviscida TaxID=2480587 RepID=A0A8H5B4S5_9AGAR|nr:hypothetical protein D9619_006446 [Psilocybe cf. subviscida]